MTKENKKTTKARIIKNSLFDRMFERFQLAVKNTLDAKLDTFEFQGRTIKVEHINTLDKIGFIRLDGREYDMMPCRINKARLAADGYLGQDQINLGRTMVEHFDAMPKWLQTKYYSLYVLWGDLTDAVWAMKSVAAYYLPAVDAAKFMLEEKKLFSSQDELRAEYSKKHQDGKLEMLTDSDWHDICRVVSKLID